MRLTVAGQIRAARSFALENFGVVTSRPQEWNSTTTRSLEPRDTPVSATKTRHWRSVRLGNAQGQARLGDRGGRLVLAVLRRDRQV